jgi:RHS repeat-associated protein
VYQYDALGQVTNGIKHWSDSTVVAGQQFGYGFDTIGNRTMSLAGGDQTGANRRLASYTANSLNQYTSRTVPGAVDVIGSATNTATVWVNRIAAYRKNNYYWETLSLNNSSTALWAGVTNLAALPNGTSAEYGVTNIGHVFLPQTPESYTYDADGNLLSDGRWTYIWDGENRLVNMTSLSGAPTGSKLRLDFTYDYVGRRIQKLVWTNNGSSYVAAYTNRFVYDGWNVTAIINPNRSISASFMWGTDLSGSMHGAGGVGGLLAENVVGNGVQFVACDANGNIAALVNASAGSVSANYEYGPFGEVIRATGPMAKLNPFRFSTKYQDDETGFLYYGYRYYNPSTGRWPSRDPAGEHAARDLYCFVCNDPLSLVDFLGKLTWINDTPSWSEGTTVSGFPLGTQGTYTFDPDTLAVTWPTLEVTASCGQTCYKNPLQGLLSRVKLVKPGVTVHFKVSVTVRPGLSTAEHNFAMQHEPEHIADFENWANNVGNPLAARLEKPFYRERWFFESSCKNDVVKGVSGPLTDSLQQAIDQSISTWDTTGLHTFQP